MANRTPRGTSGDGHEYPEGRPVDRLSGTTGTLETFAEDLGQLLGSTRAKAEGWISQRNTISDYLVDIRNTASGLLDQLTGSGATPAATFRKARRGRRRQATHPPAQAPGTETAAPQKRTMSPKARQAISIAQKARWARLKRANKKAGGGMVGNG